MSPDLHPRQTRVASRQNRAHKMSIGNICRGRRCPCRICPVLLFASLSLVVGSGASADWHMRQVANLARGVSWTMGCAVPFQPSGDSPPQLIFSAGIPNSNDGVYFYRSAPMNRFELVKVDTGGRGDSVISPGWMIPWTSGTFNLIPRSRLVAMNYEYHPQSSYLLVTLYGPSSYSLCPDSLVWRARCDTSTSIWGPIYCSDLDRDGWSDVAFFVDAAPWGKSVYLRRVVR